MKIKDLQNLDTGTWVELRDGRKGRIQNIVPNPLQAIVNVKPEDDYPYGKDVLVYPAQIKGTC